MTIQVAPFPFIQPQFFGSTTSPLFSAGQPLSGGLLYTYAAGTLTPQTTWTDETMSAENTNPIVLDANGRCNVWLNTAEAYHMVLTDGGTPAVTIFDEDNITAPTGSSALTEASIIAALGYTPYNATNPNAYITASNVLTISGAVTGVGTASSVTTTLANSGVTAGTYNSVTVNNKGIITAGSNTTSALTTKGDILGFSTVPARIPVGANGQVLTANSSAALGVSWQTASGTTIANGATTTLTRTGGSGNVADPELTIALEASTAYNITAMWYGYSPSAGVYIGMYYGATFVTGFWSGSYGTSAPASGNLPGASINTQYLFASGIDQPCLIVMNATIVTTAAGNFSVTWGNAGAGANSMYRYASSGIIATQVS